MPALEPSMPRVRLTSSALETPPVAPQRAESKKGCPTDCGETGPRRQREWLGTRRQRGVPPPDDQRVDIHPCRTRQSLADRRARMRDETPVRVASSGAQGYANEQQTGSVREWAWRSEERRVGKECI